LRSGLCRRILVGADGLPPKDTTTALRSTDTTKKKEWVR
jgi:hypothetical protein